MRAIALILFLATSSLWACPSCIGDPMSREVKAIRAGVLLMLGVLALIGGGIALFFRKVSLRSRAALLRPESNR